MSHAFCAREAEVFELVAIGMWPGRARPELLAHVAGCAACADMVIVALAVQDARDSEPAVPDAAVVWQRAQTRARQDAASYAARPVVAAQLVAAIGLVVSVAGVVLWLVGLLSAWGRASGATSDVVAMVQAAGESAGSVAAGMLVRGLPAGFIWMLSAAIVASLVLVGIALGLSTLADRVSDSPTSR